MTRVVSVTPIALERDSRTLKHAASLARLGYESIVVEEAASSSLPEGLPFQLITTAHGAAAPPAETSKLALARRFLGDYREANRRTHESLPEAELYWLHSYWQFPAIRRKCRRTGARLVYDAHDSYRDLPPVTLPAIPSVLALVERLCVRGAAARSTVSEGVARRLRERFGREFTVVRNCHELRLDRPAPATLRETLGLSGEDFLLVMVGQRKHGLALEEATAALRELDTAVHLAFVGAGFEREGTGIEAGRSRVHFVSPVPPTEVTDFIRGADAAALLYRPLTANLANALPNGFFHAVAAGLPLLYPPLQEVRALAERYRLGLPIDPADPVSIAAAIRGLEGDPARLRALGEQVARAREELSWEREEPILAELARTALAGGPG